MMPFLLKFIWLLRIIDLFFNMKIIHISDLHFPETGKTALLIEGLLEYYTDEKVKPIVICTGDIIDSPSKKRDFLQAKQTLLKLVEGDFSLLLCPGNHDLKFEGIGPIITGLNRFNNYFAELLPKGRNFYGEEDNNLSDFPLVHQFEDHFFIGLNSLEDEKGVGATGELGVKQIGELDLVLKEIRSNNEASKIIVYLHHHPLQFEFRPEFMKLKDKDVFLETIKGVDVLLFGHLHFNERFAEDETQLEIGCIHLGGNCLFGEHVRWTEIDTENYKSRLIKHF